jgi:putative lipoic acid-binding regulatory protein
MELKAFDWDPNTIDFPIPWGTQQILIYTYFKASLTLHIKFDRRALIELETGLNFLCLCNLYRDRRGSEYVENTLLGTFISKIPSKLFQYNTHTPSDRILLVAESFSFTPNLEYLSKISVLRSNFLESIQSKLKEFPVPIQIILENCLSHKGEVELLTFNQPDATLPGLKPKNCGRYEWVKIPICASNHHQLGTLIKSFDFSYSNFRPKKPFFFFHD